MIRPTFILQSQCFWLYYFLEVDMSLLVKMYNLVIISIISIRLKLKDKPK